jgi:hypothetical protein
MRKLLNLFLRKREVKVFLLMLPPLADSRS